MADDQSQPAKPSKAKTAAELARAFTNLAILSVALLKLLKKSK